MADRYYKKPNGTVTKITPQHDVDKIFKKGRRGGDWIECDKNGKELKKVTKKVVKTKKVSKKNKK